MDRIRGGSIAALVGGPFSAAEGARAASPMSADRHALPGLIPFVLKQRTFIPMSSGFSLMPGTATARYP
jgi:hypothetical protein